MTRICFLVRSLDRGGAERQLVELSRRLASRGFGVTVLTFYSGGALADELRGTAVRLVSLHKRGRWDVLPFVARTVRAVRAAGSDVLHGWLGMANLLALVVGRGLGTRVVWGVRSAYMDLSRYDWLARLEYRLAARAARFADAVVFNSWAGLSYHEAGGYRCRRAYVVPNGIDTGRFAPDAAARERVRAEWGVEPGQPMIGLVGRLDPMKDHETFLRAMKIVMLGRPEVRAVCVGDGPDEAAARLRALGDQLGVTTRWEAARVDVEAVYNACDLVVLSSYGEGFPNVLAEAMACGTPCVTTDVGDAARIVGPTGRIVPPRDPLALARAIEQMLSTRPPGAESPRERVVRLFDADRMVRDYGDVLQMVVGRPLRDDALGG